MRLPGARRELLRLFEASEPQVAQLVAVRVEEDDGRDADDAVLLRERLRLRIVGERQVGLHAPEALQLRGDAFVAERLGVELFTRDAPVGVESSTPRRSATKAS